MNENRRPNWTVWRNVPSVKVWEAIALSLDIDPRKINHNPHSWMADDYLFQEQQIFEDRLLVAERNLSSAGPLVPLSYGETSERGVPVSLPQFASWARSLDWKLPNEMAELATANAAAKLSTKPVHWPWGTHETVLLRHLAAAARKWWVNYDAADPSTAPTNEQVSTWLESEGVAQRVAQVIAQMLRADNLPPGPRR